MVAWSYKKEITVDYTKVAGDLTNFPLLVHLDSDGDLANHAQPSGDDIRFEDSNGNQLSHEIESYDSSTGTLWAHVKLPSVSGGVNTTIIVKYGNSDAVNQESVADTWTNGYGGVYHLNESASGTGTTDVYQDSTANNNHGTDLISASDAAGQLSGGVNPDGADDEVLVPHDPALNISGNHAVSFWVKRDGSRRQFVSKRGSDGASYQFWDATRGFRYFNGSLTNRIGDPPTGWVHAMFTHTGSDITFYINGSPVKTVSISDSNATTSDLHFGQDGAGNFGTLPFDEVRIQTVNRSDAWVKTTYANQDSPLTFYSVGSEQLIVPSKRAFAVASSDSASGSSQTVQRNTPTTAVSDTEAQTRQAPSSMARLETASTATSVAALPTPTHTAITPTAIAARVATTPATDIRTSVTTARSTALETKSRFFKFAQATANSSVRLGASFPPNFPRNPSLHLPLDDTDDGTATDTSDNEYVFDVINAEAANGIDGSKNTALSFAPDKSRVVSRVIDPFYGFTEFAISIWFYPTKTKGQVLFGAERAYEVVFDGRAKNERGLWWAIDNGTGDWSVNKPDIPSLALDKWHHVILQQQKGVGVVLYVDGEKYVVDDTIGPVNNPDAPLMFGRRGRDKIGPFFGRLDEPRLYTRALTDAEATSLFENPLASGTVGLVTSPTRAAQAFSTGEFATSLRPTSLTQNRRLLNTDTALDPAYRNRSDTVEYEQQPDTVEYHD